MPVAARRRSLFDMLRKPAPPTTPFVQSSGDGRDDDGMLSPDIEQMQKALDAMSLARSTGTINGQE